MPEATAMLATASHSPILDFPARQTEAVDRVLEGLAALRSEIEAYDPDLVVLFGVDHYGGHQMKCMPAFCIGVEATALADVGGTPGVLDVPRELALAAVGHTRDAGVDVAVSYAMEVDHGFTQALVRLASGIDRYPVLPIFVSCIQPPLVPFARARALGAAVGDFLASVDRERILVVGTGGLSHNPRLFFPPIDEVRPEWRPYHLLGKAQTQVSQQAWIDYEIEAHETAAGILVNEDIPAETFGLHPDWDRDFLDLFCAGDMAAFDDWRPERIAEEIGIGTLEVLSWIAAGEAMRVLTGAAPVERTYQSARAVGIGFGICSAGPAPRR